MLGIGTKKKALLMRDDMHLIGHQLQSKPRVNGVSTFMSKNGEILNDCMLM